MVITDSVTEAGNNTVLNIVVTEPGTNNPVSSDIIEDALFQSLQDDNTTAVSNLNLAVVNVPVISTGQRENVISVRLESTRADQVRVLI